MTTNNDDLFAALAGRKAESDAAVERNRIEMDRIQAEQRAEAARKREAWENMRNLIDREREAVNGKLAPLGATLLFEEEDLPRGGNQPWLLYFAFNSQHLQGRFSAQFIRHDDGSVQVRFKQDSAINIVEERSFRNPADFTAEQASMLVNRLLNLAINGK